MEFFYIARRWIWEIREDIIGPWGGASKVELHEFFCNFFKRWGLTWFWASDSQIKAEITWKQPCK